MSLGDVIVQRELTDAEAREALRALFDVAAADVRVVHDLSELAEQPAPAKVVCHKWNLPAGQFRTVLSLHEGPFAEAPYMPLAVKLSRIVGSNCLVTDEALNPYSMTLVTPAGLTQPVTLSPEALDREEYSIASPPPSYPAGPAAAPLPHPATRDS